LKGASIGWAARLSGPDHHRPQSETASRFSWRSA